MGTPGKRLPDAPPGKLAVDLDLSSICYWKRSDGAWMLYVPGSGIGDLTNHDVEEHEDGTISVTPSILVTNARHRRHGYLSRGVWEPCGDDNQPEL